MQYREFVYQVKELIGLEYEEEAESVTKAVLQTLGERLSRTECQKLAAQLPIELKSILFECDRTEHFTLEEFYNRVISRAGITYPHAVKRSLAVMEALRLAISPGELRDILAELPLEYEELFGKEPESAVSPTSLTSEQEKRMQHEE